MKKKQFIISVIIIVLIVSLVFLKPYFVFYKYEKIYNQESTSKSLFDLCNVSADCYDYSLFCKNTKKFLDTYTVEEILYFYTNIELKEAKEIYDAMLAEFLVKSVIYNHYSNDVLVKYFDMYQSSEDVFSKLIVNNMKEYCKSPKKQERFEVFLKEVEEKAVDVNDKMLVYVIQIYLYELLDDKEAIDTVINKHSKIRTDFYADQSRD